MAYSTNPNLPKARALAMRLLVREGIPSQIVERKRYAVMLRHYFQK
jgi:hypothetical protein